MFETKIKLNFKDFNKSITLSSLVNEMRNFIYEIKTGNNTKCLESLVKIIKQEFYVVSICCCLSYDNCKYPRAKTTWKK